MSNMDRLKQKLRSGELLVPGDQWPLFVYAAQAFDHEDPWKGLFKSRIMIQVRHLLVQDHSHLTRYLQSFKHVFTSPSSVDNVNKATRSGNARIHGMTRVTPASIAYIATQVSMLIANCVFDTDAHRHIKVRFALSSSAVFSRTDITTDSETFYNSVMDYFEDPDEQEGVQELLVWWNRWVLFMLEHEHGPD